MTLAFGESPAFPATADDIQHVILRPEMQDSGSELYFITDTLEGESFLATIAWGI